MYTKRNYKRIEIPIDIILNSKNNYYKANVVDISLKGILIKLKQDLDLNKNKIYTAHIPLTQTKTKIAMQIKIAWKKNKNYGIVCQNIDIDSMTHLKKLLELNGVSPLLLTRELGIFS